MSDGARACYVKMLAQMTNDVGMADLTIPELADFVALLIPAHQRVLAERPATVAGWARQKLCAVPNQTLD
jgi:hypothetical protein